jgi:hypothetical protein
MGQHRGTPTPSTLPRKRAAAAGAAPDNCDCSASLLIVSCDRGSPLATMALPTWSRMHSVNSPHVFQPRILTLNINMTEMRVASHKECYLLRVVRSGSGGHRCLRDATCYT